MLRSRGAAFRRLAARHQSTIASTKKPKRRLRSFLLWSTFLVLAGYGGGAYLSLNNPRARDFYSETFPYGSEVVDYLEDRTLDKLGANKRVPTSPKVENAMKEAREKAKQKAEQLRLAKEKAEAEAKRKAAELESKAAKAAEQVAEEARKVSEAVQNKGKETVEAVKTQVAHVKEALAAPVDVPAPIVPDAASETTVISEPLPLGFEAPPGVAYTPAPARKLLSAQEKAALLPPPLPLVAPSITEYSKEEPVIGQLASTIDSLAGFLKDNPDTAFKSDSVKAVLFTAETDLKSLGDRIHTIQQNQHASLEASLQKQQDAYSRQLEEKEKALLERLSSQEDDWKQNFELEREKLRDEYRSKLETELTEQKELINQRLKEELIAQGIEMQRRWLREIKIKVEEERAGRLSRLDELSSSVKKLEKVTLENDGYLEESLRINRLWSAIQVAKDVEDRPFDRELAALKHLAAKTTSEEDPASVISLALESIALETASTGIASFSILSNWFSAKLVPSIKKAALMPEHGGCLSYFTSAALSPLLFEKSGYDIGGKDVMSVISRANYWLDKRDLDSATREVNQLKGWPKILARDWLEAARRHLEVKQALSVAETEAKLRGLLVV